MSFAKGVAEHYNQVEQKSFSERRHSSIIGVRNFNNAMKSFIIHLGIKYHLKTGGTRSDIRILDLSCGKGGDLIKYNKVSASFVGGADIADVSINQCRKRFEELKKSSKGRCFDSKFVVADLTREPIKHNFEEQFNFAFSQFAIHYSFESYDQAIRYISNAAENLRTLGFFIGTYPDGPKLVKMARESETPGIFTVEDLLEVKFDKADLRNPKPFGTKYHFKLKEVVDCPEFLVHPATLEKLLQQCGFVVQFHGTFEELLTKALHDSDSRDDRDKVIELFGENYHVLNRDYENSTAKFDDTTWRIVSLYRWFLCRKRTK